MLSCEGWGKVHMTSRGKIGWLVPVGIVLSAVICAVLVWSWHQASSADEWVTHTSDVRAAAFELRSHILAAELERHSELLTGDRTRRRAFAAETRHVFRDLRRVRGLTHDNAKQSGQLSEVGALARTFFDRLRSAMDTADRAGTAAALAEMRSTGAASLGEAVRGRIDDVLAEEDALLAQRARRASTMSLYALLELVGASLVLGTIGTYAFQTRRTVRVVDAERRRFGAIFQNATDAMILFDASLLVHDANRAALEVLERDREDVVGQRMSALAPAVPSLAWRKPYHGQSTLGRPPRIIDMTTTPDVLEGLHLAVFRDVTRRARVEEARRVLVEASEVLASPTTDDDVLRKLAEVVVKGFAEGCRVGIVEEDELRLVADAKVDPEIALPEEVTRHWPGSVKRVVRTGRGELHPESGEASVMIVPICGHRRTLGALLIASPKTGRLYGLDDLAVAEDLGRRAGMAIEQLRALARERDANRAKDEFLATVSHELRTPLTAILGWARLVPSLPPKEVAKGITTIERNATALARLVDDVLDVSRIITGKLQIAQEPLDLADVLRACLRVVEPMARAKSIAIESHVEPCPFYGDAGRLQQVFWNLLSNAVKFTPAGGRASCTLEREGANVTVTVRDNGRGIDPDFLPFVFERFRQHDSSTTRAFGGLGLGLAIVRHLVELHGGNVRAESAGRGRGATFVVELPVRAVATEMKPSSPADEGAREAPAERASPPRPLEGVNVLVCDDDLDARYLVCAVLEHAGANVEAVDSASAAVDAVRMNPPNVLVSDIGMPGEDGYSLMRRVRTLDRSHGGDVPAIALTAYASADDVARALAAGFQEHIAKPVDPEMLVEALASLTGHDAPAS